MIIDCHTHISPNPDSEAVSAHLKACEKVNACIVLADSAGRDDDANEQLRKYVGQQEKMIGFAAVNPLADKVRPKAVKALTKDTGLKGLALFCAENGFHPANSRAMRLYEAAQELELPVFFHNCGPYSANAVLDYAQPFLLDEVARTFPKLKIIIAGMGAPFVQQCLAMLAKHENVYADLSVSPSNPWGVYNIVISAYEAKVMDKLLFGSGYPCEMPGVCIETLLGFNKIFSDTHLPQVPREQLRAIVERDSLSLLGMT